MSSLSSHHVDQPSTGTARFLGVFRSGLRLVFRDPDRHRWDAAMFVRVMRGRDVRGDAIWGSACRPLSKDRLRRNCV